MSRPAPAQNPRDTRHDWTRDEALSLYRAPFSDLIYRAQAAHREHFPANTVQLSTLLNIKTGGCPEDCAYCPQSARYDTAVDAAALLPVDEVRAAARRARDSGATRFCMGAAWRSPKDRDIEKVAGLVEAVKAEGLETCVTLGMLTDRQAQRLKQSGLDYYNHNIDTSPEYYAEIITTRGFEDRIRTLESVRAADLKVCCGGIIGMGESDRDRIGMLVALANLPQHPESVPINMLVPVEGTPLANAAAIDPLELVRTIAVARIMMPASYVRLSAGRTGLSRAEQALCFIAGANSIFYGDRLLTTGNPDVDADLALFADLGISAENAVHP
ncbi:MAG: biotin synthase BioB [Gammaproteobacteria bacterium]